MTQQVCPRCLRRAMVWVLDDANVTSWHCSNCAFVALEDESAERRCPECGELGDLLLTADGEAFRWCLTCQRRERAGR